MYQQIHAPVPIETRGLVAEWEASSRELTMWASTQTPHELRAFAARLLGIPAQNVRVIMRDTGGGFGQKVVPMREDMCIMLAARKVPGALKWIEDRRENLMSAGQARHVDGDVRMAFDDDGNILAADIDFVQDVGAYPTPYPVLTTAAIGMFFPGPYRVPKASFNYKTVFSNTAGLARLPRPLAVRNPHPRNTSRHRGAQDGHGSRRTAPPQHPARRRDAVLQPQRHAV